MFENNVSITGNLTADPEMRYGADSQMAILKFRVAVNRQKRNGEDRGADFINCVAFGKTAEVAEQYLVKGFKVGVHGRWTTGQYKDKDGKTVFTNELTVEDLLFLSRRDEVPRKETGVADTFAALNEDVPF